MSRVGKESIICELCGEKLEVDIYESINVTLNPHLKEKVLNGDIYKFTCPFCKHDHYISYPFVYFDMENKYMIHMGELPELLNMYYTDIKNDSLSNDFPGLSDSILHLGVDSYRELCSKIVMLDHGIDYKVGTLYSLYFEIKYQKLIDAAHKEGEPKAEVCDSFFATHDGNVIVVVDVTLNDDADTHRTLSEVFDPEQYRNIYELYKTKADEVFNFCFNREVAYKLFSVVDEEIDDFKNLIVEVAILETTDGDSLLAVSPIFNEGKYNIGDVVCVNDNDILKKYRIKNILNMDMYSYPLTDVLELSYKISDIMLETQADSRDVIVNDELKAMFNTYNDKGFNVKLMIKSNVIVGAECRMIPATGEIQTRLIKYNNDGKTLLSVYLEQNELTNENASRFIYNLDDVIRLVLNNPDRYDGIIINPESDKVIIDNSRLVEYGYNRIMCNSYLMKRLLDKLNLNEIDYIGDFNYKVIRKVYNEKTSPKKIAEDLNVCFEKVDEALTNGYQCLKEVVLTNYLNKELLLMDIKIDNIKEISLVSYKSNGNKIEYKDLLRISPKWYSYTRTDLDNNKDINYWSYKSNLEYIYKKFNDLCDIVVYEFNNPHKEFTGDSDYKFNLRINLYDGTHLDINRVGRFIDNDMSDVAISLLRCIPELESYPDVIGLFQSRYLTKERLKSININNLCGYMYAEDGAMGDPGCISLITTDLTRYYVDGHCGRLTDFHYYDLDFLLDSFDYRQSYHKATLELLTINDSNWLYLNLGAGNHLFLRSDMFDYIGNMILDNDRVRMYGKWRHLIEPCGDDNTCTLIEVDGDALENECDILCHQVNLDGVMGGGIALSIAKRYPLVKKEYQDYPNKKLGEVCFVKTDDYVVANCFSQRKSFVTDYDALRDCLDKVVNYMKCNHKTSVAIPYKYGCGIANGDWDIVRSIFEEKFKGYTLVIYKLKSKTTDSKECVKPVNKNPLVMLYEALSCLHKKGYENIRIMSYFSPSGLYLRCVITLKDYFNHTGFVCEDSDNYPIFRYTTAADFIYFKNEDSYENKTVEELADRILKECPLLKKLGKGKDEEYLAWYKQVLALVREEKYPYAFDDCGYSIYGEGKIKLTNGEWISYAPPGGIKH